MIYSLDTKCDFLRLQSPACGRLYHAALKTESKDQWHRQAIVANGNLSVRPPDGQQQKTAARIPTNIHTPDAKLLRKRKSNHPRLQLMSPRLPMPTLVRDRGTATTAKGKAFWQRTVVSVIRCMSKILESIPEVLLVNRNRELDWLDISYDNWLTTCHVHVVGWLLAKWCDGFFSGPFFPPL